MSIQMWSAAVCVIVMSGLAGATAGPETQPPAEGTALPAITLPAPIDPDHGTYLGVSGKQSFTVADIPAEVVIIEIFNMY